MKKEKAQLMFKLAFSKRNWGAKYDRTEHYKRFPHLNQIIKKLIKYRIKTLENDTRNTNATQVLELTTLLNTLEEMFSEKEKKNNTFPK